MSHVILDYRIEAQEITHEESSLMDESSSHKSHIEQHDVQVNQVKVDDGVSVGLSQPPYSPVKIEVLT